MDNVVYTIGHSTRSLDELVQILRHYKVDYLVDVRTMPRSRTNPHFNRDALQIDLPARDIHYQHIAQLGGLRPTNKESPNTGWRNKSFRGYADHMQTSEFQSGLNQLVKLTSQHTVALMCAEAVPWRCHRSMIGDALLVRQYHVIDIFDLDKSTPEKLTSFAKVDGHDITYPDY